MRRIATLALALGSGRIAGTGFDPNGQAHFGDGRFEIARDVDGKRLERRYIECVQPAFAAHIAAG